MTPEKIEEAFFYIGHMKGHVDGLHLELKKPHQAQIALNEVFEIIVRFMEAGSKAIRELEKLKLNSPYYGKASEDELRIIGDK